MSERSLQCFSKNQTSSKLDPYLLLHSILTTHSHSHLQDVVKVTKLYQPIHALDSTAICKQLILHVMQLLGRVSIFLYYEAFIFLYSNTVSVRLPLTEFLRTVLSEIGNWLVAQRLVI